MNDLTVTYEEVILERLEYNIDELIDGELLSSMDVGLNKKFFLEKRARDMVIRLRAYVMAEETNKQIIRYPADWWEAFKERWFGKWLKSKIGVKYKEIEVKAYATYPKLQIAFPKQDTKHIVKFMRFDKDRMDYSHNNLVMR